MQLTFSLGIFFLPQSLHCRGNFRQISSWAYETAQRRFSFLAWCRLGSSPVDTHFKIYCGGFEWHARGEDFKKHWDLQQNQSHAFYLNVLKVESHFAVFTVERPGFTFPLIVSVLLRKEDCHIASLAGNSLKLTAAFMLSLKAREHVMWALGLDVYHGLSVQLKSHAMLLVIIFWTNTTDMIWPGYRSVFWTSASLGQDVLKTSSSNNNNNKQDLQKRNNQKNVKK